MARDSKPSSDQTDTDPQATTPEDTPTSETDTPSNDNKDDIVDAEFEAIDADTPKADASDDEPEDADADKQADEDTSDIAEKPADEAPKDVEPTVEEDAPAASTPQTIIEKRGGFGAAFLGGLIAAGLGFGAGVSGQFTGAFMPDDAPTEAPAEAGPSELAQSNAAQINAMKTAMVTLTPPDIAPLEARIAALEAAEPVAGGVDTTAVDAALVEMKTQLQQQLDTIAALQQQITTLEQRPAVATNLPSDVLDGLTAGIKAEQDRTQAMLSELRTGFEAQVATLMDTLAEAQAQTDADIAQAREDQQRTEAEAAAATQSAQVKFYLTDVKLALQNGTDFSGDLAALAGADVAVPDGLTAVQAGVVTQSKLTAMFPDAARAALAASRAGDDGGFWVYLQKQLGARSVTPREGGSADAILSRAEAAATAGDLTTALTELQGLADVAQPAMADWIAAATARQTALNDFAAMSAAAQAE